MPENDFLVWAAGSGANVLSQSDYAASSLLLNGAQPNAVASSAANNKTLRQTSVFSSAWAQYIVAQTGQPVIDDGTTATILANLTQAILNAGAANASYSVSANNNLTLNYGFVRLLDPSTGEATFGTNFPTAVWSSTSGLPIPRYIIWNHSNTQQLLASPISGNFDGPAGTGTNQIYINPGDLYLFWSDGANWITSLMASAAQLPGGRGIINFTTPGAFSWIVPAGVTSIDVIMTGGGGAGGGANSNVFDTAHAAAGAGGGGGSTAIFKASVTPGSTLSGTIGAAGVGNSNANGSNGGATSFLGVSAPGGAGGQGGAVSASAGGLASGVPSGTPTGLLGLMTSINGGDGQDGQLGALFCGAMGGASFWGGGSRAAGNPSVTPADAPAPGAGGGGVYAVTTALAGRAGGPGIVQIKWP